MIDIRNIEKKNRIRVFFYGINYEFIKITLSNKKKITLQIFLLEEVLMKEYNKTSMSCRKKNLMNLYIFN